MHGMANSESAEMNSTLQMLVSVNTVIRQHWNTKTAVEVSSVYYNGNELCIATYNCFIFERLYACDDMFFCVLFSVTSKLMQSVYDPRMNCCAGIFTLKWNI